jgi:hypothetical protein
LPTIDEIDRYPHIVLSDGDNEWDPKGVEMRDDGHHGGFDDHRRINEARIERDKLSLVPMEFESDLCLGSISDHLVPDRMYERLVSSVHISRLPADTVMTKWGPVKKRTVDKQVTATSRHSVITPVYLARLMGVTIDKAKEMLRVTTQKGIS